MHNKPRRLSAIRTVITALLLLMALAIGIFLANTFFDLLYISSRVGSSLSWEAAYLAFEESFAEGMSREEVHARLIEMDPSLDGKLQPLPKCSVRNGEVRCVEYVIVFEDHFSIGSGFSYYFDYNSELRLIAVERSS